MDLKNLGLKDFFFLGKSVLNFITSIFITSALFASALVVSALSAFILIILAGAASFATAKPLMRRALKAWLLFAAVQ